MEAKLTIQERLKDLRLEKGWTLSELAQKTGLSRSALGSYEQDDYKDISHRAIYRLAKCYGVSADYLLGLTENRTMINTPLSELHLNDKMVKLLKDERINARLLCEMASHDGFPRLMEDIEIYVDGHAAMAIGFLNEYYEQQRQLLLKNPNTTRDNFMRSIEAAANIDENAYFAMMIHNDIDEIIRDIHSRHKEDASTASKINISATITEALDESRAVQGNVFFKGCRMSCSGCSAWIKTVHQQNSASRWPISSSPHPTRITLPGSVGNKGMPRKGRMETEIRRLLIISLIFQGVVSPKENPAWDSRPLPDYSVFLSLLIAAKAGQPQLQ